MAERIRIRARRGRKVNRDYAAGRRRFRREGPPWLPWGGFAPPQGKR